MGLRLMQFYGLRGQVELVTELAFYLTLTANRPATLIPIKRATSEFAGSITTTSPVQSSLKLVCLQFGQTGPALIILQFLQALSLNLMLSLRRLYFQIFLNPFQSSKEGLSECNSNLSPGSSARKADGNYSTSY